MNDPVLDCCMHHLTRNPGTVLHITTRQVFAVCGSMESFERWCLRGNIRHKPSGDGWKLYVDGIVEHVPDYQI